MARLIRINYKGLWVELEGYMDRVDNLKMYWVKDITKIMCFRDSVYRNIASYMGASKLIRIEGQVLYRVEGQLGSIKCRIIRGIWRDGRNRWLFLP